MYTKIKTITRIVSLDSLRGLLALLIVIFHFDSVLQPIGNNLFFKKGYLGTDFFFMLSGFGMYAGYSRLFLGKINWKVYLEFVRSRLTRIFPLYLFSMWWMWQLYNLFILNNLKIDQNTFSETTILANTLLLQSISFDRHLSWNLAAWALSTLWMTYLFFPLLVRMAGKYSHMLWVVIGAGYLFVNYYLYPLSESITSVKSSRGFSLDVTHDFGIVRCLLGFVLGILTYKLYSRQYAKRWLTLGPTIYILLLVWYELSQFWISDIWYILVFLLMMLSVSYDTNILLKLGPIQFLGKISYSIYLVHIPLIFSIVFLTSRYPNIREFCTTLPKPIYLTMFLVLVIIISTATYHLIEKPSKAWLNQKKTR